MEHPGGLDQHNLNPLGEALEADVEQGPVPVVVVKGAELGPAVVELVPEHPGEGHTHIVLGTDPGGEINLGRRGKSEKVNQTNSEANTGLCFYEVNGIYSCRSWYSQKRKLFIKL